MAALTDRKASSIKPGDCALPDGTVVGLTLEPLATKGRGKWRLRYVSPVTGKRRTMVLGGYPTVSIAEAREQANKAREIILAGGDPIEARSAQPKEVELPDTFEQWARQVYAELQPSWKNLNHIENWIKSLETYVFPYIGAMPGNSIKPSHVADALRPIWLEKAETASRIKQRIHTVMAWAWAHGLVETNPVDVVGMILPKQQKKKDRTEHLPAMPWRQIPMFVKEHLRDETRPDCSRPLLEFVMLTACRSGEAREMVWDEVDFAAAVWTVPAERMKMGQIHRVPLSARAMEILREQKARQEAGMIRWREGSALAGRLVFPTINGKLPSNMILTQFLRRANAASDVPGRPATAHGFRSSFRDWASENGYPRDMAERALAHAVANQVEAAYHRTDLLEQRRPMMQAWADFLTGQSGEK